ncbi:MAG: DUF4295 family protein [Cytophagales bacterium]|nr:DUF4295 family protein [Cytophagales bacterium]
MPAPKVKKDDPKNPKKAFLRVIRMVRKPKTNSYGFREDMVLSSRVQEFLQEK